MTPPDASAGQRTVGDRAFEALGCAVAVLDGRGTIVATNAAWRADTERSATRRAVGARYLVGRSALVDLDLVLEEGIGRVLAGRSDRFELEHPVDGPAGRRWHLLVATPMAGGAVVVHVDVTTHHDVRDLLDARAHRDPLTGLANRRATSERLSNAVKRATTADKDLTVMFLDLDGFKAVNDDLGHEVGDEVLVAVGRRLANTVRAADSLGRWGGDEFVVVVDGGVAATQALAQRLHQALEQPVVVGGERALRISVSVGAALLKSEDSPEDVLARADQAMFEAKRTGTSLVLAGSGREEPDG